MKAFSNGGFSKAPKVAAVVAFAFISVTFFYLGKHWSDGNQQLFFFTARQGPSVSISPNSGKSFDIASLISGNETQSVSEKTFSPAKVPSPPAVPPPIPPPPPRSFQRFGIVDENGTMSDDFEVGEFDPDEVVENWATGNRTEVKDGQNDSKRVRVQKFHLCPSSMSEYIPCLDNVEAIRRLKSTERGERFERHCPEAGRGLNCLVPPPGNYRSPIPWPRSRDEVFADFNSSY